MQSKIAIPTRATLLCVLLLLFAELSLHALDPNRRLSQYAHRSWRTQDGSFRGVPYAVTQTNDGYIWLGTASGLIRFDGVRFTPFVSPDGHHLQSLEISSVLGARDGSLWIGTHAGISHLANQHLVNYPSGEGTIAAIVEDSKGTVWFVHSSETDGSGPLCQVTGTTTQCFGPADGIPHFAAADSLDEDASGNLWIGGDTALIRWKPGSSTAYSPSLLKRNAGLQGVTGFAADSDGSIWASVALPGHDLGLQHFVHQIWKPFVSNDLDGRHLEIDTVFMDRHNVLWIGTAQHGIYRINANKVDHIDARDGLSGNVVYRFCEDREGNVWATTSKGIDKFSDLQVATFTTSEGLSSGEADSLLATRDGTLWIGEADALDALRIGKVSSFRAGKGLPGHQVTSLLQDHLNRLWVGIDSGLWVVWNGRFHEIEGPNGKPFGVITDLTEDKAHDIWLESIGPPRTLFRIHDDKVQEKFSASQMPAARKVAADLEDGVWLGTRTGDLVRYRDGHAEVTSFGLPIGSQVEEIRVNPDGSVLGATAAGLVGWKRGRKQTLTVQNGLPCNDVLTLILDDTGSLWLYTRCGLVEIASAEIQRWWQQPQSVLQVKTFSELDGVQAAWAPFQKSARTPDGRLWFVNDMGVQMIDPHHLYNNPLPPPVQIEAVVADRTNYSPARNIHLPPLTRDLEIDYTALSFVAPEKVRFRYRLEGHDLSWQDPGTRRQAFYEGLRPGTYVFRVLACNNDGAWNEMGASLRFDVMAAWYQKGWVRLLACLFVSLGIVVLYQMRMRSIARAISARFDERLDERTRMALELHDTFLQTVQGSKMVADDALDPASDQVRMRHALERLSVWLEQAVTEGRAALHALRVSTTERNHLAQYLDRTAREHCQRTSISVAITVLGDARDLHPIVRDEITRIAEEAIRNACLHSKASQLSIELRYARDLTLSFADNGVGIDPEIVEIGRSGHFGISGMQERSARLQAKITISSTLNAGTVIVVRVPGYTAYQRGKLPFFGRLFDRKEHPASPSRTKRK